MAVGPDTREPKRSRPLASSATTSTMISRSSPFTSTARATAHMDEV